MRAVTSWLLLVVLCKAGHYFEKPTKYDKVCNVFDYGAKGDGKTNDTLSILSAINDCYNSSNISGQVLLPSNYTFLTSALLIHYESNNCALYISSNTTLLATNNRTLWPSTYNLLDFANANNFIIEGGGEVNGNGYIWWQHTNNFRPHIINMEHVNGLIIRNILFTQCPNHCLELYANYAEIYNISIINPPSNNNSLNVTEISHNTDGIDVHGSPFYVHDSIISTGDDNIAIHANDTLIENCFFGYGHGTSIGSLGGGWYKNITVNNCTYHETDAGCHIKIHPGATNGHVWDVKFTNLDMIGISMYSLGITEYYGSNENVSTYLFVNNILYENITSFQNSSKLNKDPPGEFLCQPSSPCTNITLNNIKITAGNTDYDQWQCQDTQIFAHNVEPPLKSCYS